MEEACLVKADAHAGCSSATVWASRVYGDYRDYMEITLIDLTAENGDSAARAEAFGEFVEAVRRYLPS